MKLFKHDTAAFSDLKPDRIARFSGSLPATSDGQKIRLSIISFAVEPNLLVGFNDNQQRETVFRKMEEIKAEHGKPAYAKAINFALE